MENEVIRMRAALELLLYKAKKEMTGNKRTCLLDQDDINEVLIVAGFPEAKPDEVISADMRTEDGR